MGMWNSARQWNTPESSPTKEWGSCGFYTASPVTLENSPGTANSLALLAHGAWVSVRCYSAMSDCLHPNGLQPTQLLCSWDSPGKNTRVGCHFLLQGNLPNPGIKPESSALAGRFFTTEPLGKPLAYGVQWQRSPLRKRWRCCLLEAGLTNTKVRQVTEYGQGTNNVHNFQRLTRLNCTVLEVVSHMRMLKFLQVCNRNITYHCIRPFTRT